MYGLLALYLCLLSYYELHFWLVFLTAKYARVPCHDALGPKPDPISADREGAVSSPVNQPPCDRVGCLGGAPYRPAG